MGQTVRELARQAMLAYDALESFVATQKISAGPIYAEARIRWTICTPSGPEAENPTSVIPAQGRDFPYEESNVDARRANGLPVEDQL